MSTANDDDNYSSLSRIGYDNQSGKYLILRNLKNFIDEESIKWNSPFTKGVLVNFLNYNELFQLGLSSLDIVPEKRGLRSHSLTYLQRPFQPARATCNFIEYIFELEGFAAILPILPGQGLQDDLVNKSGLLLDLGHSHCHSIPILFGEVVKPAIRRLDLGGKVLTKCLMDSLSTFQLKVHKHFFLVNEIREKAFTFLEDSDTLNYLMPDYSVKAKGMFIKKGDESNLNKNSYLSIGNERRNIAEALFIPPM